MDFPQPESALGEVIIELVAAEVKCSGRYGNCAPVSQRYRACNDRIVDQRTVRAEVLDVIAACPVVYHSMAPGHADMAEPDVAMLGTSYDIWLIITQPVPVPLADAVRDD